MNGAESLCPRLAPALGRAQCAAGRGLSSGQILGEFSRLVEAHRRGRHDPRLRADLAAKFEELRNPHGNVVGSLKPCAVAGPLARGRWGKQVVYRAAEASIALHQPQYAGPQFLERGHHFIAEGCLIRGIAVGVFQAYVVQKNRAAGNTEAHLHRRRRQRILVGIELQAEPCPRSRQFNVGIEIAPQSRRQP